MESPQYESKTIEELKLCKDQNKGISKLNKDKLIVKLSNHIMPSLDLYTKSVLCKRF